MVRSRRIGGCLSLKAFEDNHQTLVDCFQTIKFVTWIRSLLKETTLLVLVGRVIAKHTGPYLDILPVTRYLLQRHRFHGETNLGSTSKTGSFRHDPSVWTDGN